MPATTHGYRLPKTIEADARATNLLAQLAAHAIPLWKEATWYVPCIKPGEEVRAALLSANQGGVLVRGFEGAERRLREEERGLKLRPAPQSAGLLPGASPGEEERSESGVRISRLVVVTNDGSERFYRNVEGLQRRYAPRLCAIRVEMDELELGEFLFGPGRVTRLVLLERKTAVADLLLTMAEQWQREGPDGPGDQEEE